jgi:hypothetical protein
MTTSDIDLSRISALVKDPNFDLDQVMVQLLAFREIVQTAVAETAPALPSFSDAEIEAWDTLERLLDDPKWPDTAREATEEERDWMIRVRAANAVLVSAVKRTQEEIKEAAHIHFDRVAFREGRVVTPEQATPENPATPKNKEGHYVLEDKTSFQVPGHEKTIHRSVASGSVSYGDVVIDGDRLLALYEADEIDRRTYLRYTRQARVLDTEQFRKDGQRNPEVFALLAKITKVSNPTARIIEGKADANGDSS